MIFLGVLWSVFLVIFVYLCTIDRDRDAVLKFVWLASLIFAFGPFIWWLVSFKNELPLFNLVIVMYLSMGLAICRLPLRQPFIFRCIYRRKLDVAIREALDSTTLPADLTNLTIGFLDGDEIGDYEYVIYELSPSVQQLLHLILCSD